jgi:hypothetical protein
MIESGPELVRQIRTLHSEAVERWHTSAIDNPFSGFLGTVCHQHQYNFLLWHEEDVARSPSAPDSRIAEVKRAIDRYNQQRNDWIEKLDDALLDELVRRCLYVDDRTPFNTETPGSAMDRLSILSLRSYHLNEQLQRPDIDEDLRRSIQGKLAICRQQLDDLATALGQLLEDLLAGRKQLKLYRQLKMYNDPALNPYLYGVNNTTSRKAGA